MGIRTNVPQHWLAKFGSLNNLSSKPQPNLILNENDFTPTEAQYQQYLSSYSPDFDDILKAGSWEQLEKIQIVAVTFVQTTSVLVAFVHIRF